jgi:hypothetical protein
MDVSVSITKPAYIDVFQNSLKKSNQFTCLGWVNTPTIPDSDPLIFLAVSNLAGDVVGVDSSIKFELIRDGGDFRLQFSNSVSKKIALSTGIRIDDTAWHFIGYVCQGSGSMIFYVDGISVPPETGMGLEGVLYSTAWSRSGRLGGGSVWSPYLYKSGQAVSVYNWRFGANFQLHQKWIQELMALELPVISAL